jgi:hypothetical protein
MKGPRFIENGLTLFSRCNLGRKFSACGQIGIRQQNLGAFYDNARDISPKKFAKKESSAAYFCGKFRELLGMRSKVLLHHHVLWRFFGLRQVY